jgi:hypothetical protein
MVAKPFNNQWINFVVIALYLCFLSKHYAWCEPVQAGQLKSSTGQGANTSVQKMGWVNISTPGRSIAQLGSIKLRVPITIPKSVRLVSKVYILGYYQPNNSILFMLFFNQECERQFLAIARLRPELFTGPHTVSKDVTKNLYSRHKASWLDIVHIKAVHSTVILEFMGADGYPNANLSPWWNTENPTFRQKRWLVLTVTEYVR